MGVITKSNYQSLMDHLRSGKAWDLSRKRQGLYILPPFGQGNDIYSDRIQALEGIMPFLNHSNEEYVLLSDCDLVLNFDIDAMMEAHTESGADITIAYKYGIKPERRKMCIRDSYVAANPQKRVVAVLSPFHHRSGGFGQVLFQQHLRIIHPFGRHRHQHLVNEMCIRDSCSTT